MRTASVKWVAHPAGGDESCSAWRAWLYRVRGIEAETDNTQVYDNTTMERFSAVATFSPATR